MYRFPKRELRFVYILFIYLILNGRRPNLHYAAKY